MASRKTTRSSGDGDTTRNVVTLDDLAPRHDVRGGSARRVFGADGTNRTTNAEEQTMATKKAKDLKPKKSAAVKGGKKRRA